MLRMDSQILISSSTDDSALPSTRKTNLKTPARLLKHGRAVHDENSVYGHPRTAGLTNKKKHAVSFSTPPTNKVSSRFAGKTPALTEITNQTPYIQRPPVTPLPTSIKAAKPFVVFNDDSVASSARRISSTRKKLKLPSSASKNYATPEMRGDHWDVSDTSIEASIVETASVTEEDYDDVEYGPPTAIDPKYDPGFDMPDYKQVGATLMSLFGQLTIAEEYDPVTDCDFHNGIEPLVCEELGLFDDSVDDISSFIDQLDSIHNREVVNLTVAANNSQPRLSKLNHGETATPPKVSTQKSTQRSGVPDTSKKPPAVRISSGPPAHGCATTSHTRIPSLSKPKNVQTNTSAKQTPKPPALSRNINPRLKSTTFSGTVGKTISQSQTTGASRATRFQC